MNTQDENKIAASRKRYLDHLHNLPRDPRRKFKSTWCPKRPRIVAQRSTINRAAIAESRNA